MLMLKNESRTGISTCVALAALLLSTGCSDDDSDPTGTAGSGGRGGASAGAGGTSPGGGRSGAPSGGTNAGGGGAGGVPGAGAGGAPDAESARVRVMHLSPDAPGVDVFVDGAPDAVVEGLEFPDGTGYLDVPAGTYDFAVAATGGTPDDAVLSIPGLELEAGAAYTAVAFDELESIQALALVDDYAGLGAGRIRVRAVHAAPGVGQVDIWNVPASGEPSPLWTDVDFGVAGDALDLDAGAYTVGVDVDDDATPDLTFALPALEAGTVVNVFAVNDDEANVFLVAELPDGSTARIAPE